MLLQLADSCRRLLIRFAVAAGVLPYFVPAAAAADDDVDVAASSPIELILGQLPATLESLKPAAAADVGCVVPLLNPPHSPGLMLGLAVPAKPYTHLPIVLQLVSATILLVPLENDMLLLPAPKAVFPPGDADAPAADAKDELFVAFFLLPPTTKPLLPWRPALLIDP